MRFGVVQFPGSCDERDTIAAAQRVGDAELLWHADRDLKGVDAVIVPGGFSYGDYLRAGAIARFSPVMEAVAEWAAQGGLVLGICNGFQVLCEARLLPGALLPNLKLRFVCRQVDLDLSGAAGAFTAACPQGRSLRIPAKNSFGRYYVDPGTLDDMRRRGQIVFRYVDGESFNGSVDGIAGVCNEEGNVVGLMPHPEHAVDPLTGSIDGLGIFESMRLAVDGADA
ncbi:MAG: phosphoribosylformylglycinamidine synthase subunit PurQ [Solirubrobacteraceae bacterium]